MPVGVHQGIYIKALSPKHNNVKYYVARWKQKDVSTSSMFIAVKYKTITLRNTALYQITVYILHLRRPILLTFKCFHYSVQW